MKKATNELINSSISPEGGGQGVGVDLNFSLDFHTFITERGPGAIVNK